MQRIKARRDRIDPRRRKFGGGDYPPDDGLSRSRCWNRNHLCIPCRYASRGPGLCPQCRAELVDMGWRFAVPRKQDRWWSSQQAMDEWIQHLKNLDRPAEKYLRDQGRI